MAKKVSKTKFLKTSKADGKRVAKKPGKRTTSWGTTYTENRPDRADIAPSKKSAKKGKSK